MIFSAADCRRTKSNMLKDICQDANMQLSCETIPGKEFLKFTD
jgi:hypothetical protein